MDRNDARWLDWGGYESLQAIGAWRYHAAVRARRCSICHHRELAGFTLTVISSLWMARKDAAAICALRGLPIKMRSNCLTERFPVIRLRWLRNVL